MFLASLWKPPSSRKSAARANPSSVLATTQTWSKSHQTPLPHPIKSQRSPSMLDHSISFRKMNCQCLLIGKSCSRKKARGHRGTILINFKPFSLICLIRSPLIAPMRILKCRSCWSRIMRGRLYRNMICWVRLRIMKLWTVMRFRRDHQ